MVLSDFVSRKPHGTWDDFCDDTHRKHKTQQQIFSDQRGICAYCEIQMADALTDGLEQESVGSLRRNDFRVEHFHPKKDRSDHSNNWALDWRNLLGVCCGGDERFVFVPERFAQKEDGKSDSQNHHCDSKKREKILDGKILNPLEIPAFPCLWKIIRDSSREKVFLQPDNNACNAVGSNILIRAQNSLDELNLNCDLLAGFRWHAILAIRKRVQDYRGKGKSYDEALKIVMKQTFDNTPDIDGTLPNWPSFFTTIRAYFGRFAEDRLHAINYEG